jgi:transmembrane sensor
MDYSNYDIEDLVKDAYFKKSVLRPDAHSRAFWEEWCSSGAERKERFDRAKWMVIALHEKFDEKIRAEEIARRVQRIKIEKSVREERRKKARPMTFFRFAAAALLLFGLSIGVWLSWSEKHQSDAPKSASVGTIDTKKKVEVADTDWRVNDSPSDLTLMLGDSSMVTLLPGSRLRFPSVFSSEVRTVELIGDAFFEVTSNPNAPFYVHAGETIVKVLGTVFRVTARENDEKVTVKVLSGRVSVFHSADFSPEIKRGKIANQGILLSPNEEAVLDKSTKMFATSNVAEALQKERKERQPELIFDDTPIDHVFGELERIYGMEIIYDSARFSTCPITTYFKDESLLERINMICQAVGATYKPETGSIVITGIDCTGEGSNELTP